MATTLPSTVPIPKEDFVVSGMTCGSCVAGVKSKLEALAAVEQADVQLAGGRVQLALKAPVHLAALQAALGNGKYTIAPAEESPTARHSQPTAPGAAKTPTVAQGPATVSQAAADGSAPASWLAVYRPLLMIIGFIGGVSLLAQWPLSTFDGMLYMRHFMAGFFIAFSFFKLLNLRGFADSYAMYDIIAGQWRGWGFIYPFVELALGVAYLINVFPFWTNVATIIVLGISAIGVVRSVLDKRKIKCACLGDVFNLPMSTVTIVEDVGMVLMAAAMLALR